jgi:hypothetical protein
MGFGFNLFFVFILVPLTGILLVIWLITRRKIFGKTVGLIWLGIFGLALLSGTVQWLKAKTELKKKDYYGHYIVNRDYFPGRLTLNGKISDTDGLNPSYHIGAAYFLDSNGNARQDVDNIWNLRIEPESLTNLCKYYDWTFLFCSCK